MAPHRWNLNKLKIQKFAYYKCPLHLLPNFDFEKKTATP